MKYLFIFMFVSSTFAMNNQNQDNGNSLPKLLNNTYKPISKPLAKPLDNTPESLPKLLDNQPKPLAKPLDNQNPSNIRDVVNPSQKAYQGDDAPSWMWVLTDWGD